MTHSFSVARSYNVALTVTDAAGIVVTARQFVTPLAPASPTVTLAVVPNPPLVNQQATFTATATPAPNHSIVQYDWNFGDGTNATTFSRTTTKTYTTMGTFAVVVRATDDLGQVGAPLLGERERIAAPRLELPVTQQVVERLTPAARDPNRVGEAAPPQDLQRRFDVRRIVVDQQDANVVTGFHGVSPPCAI